MSRELQDAMSLYGLNCKTAKELRDIIKSIARARGEIDFGNYENIRCCHKPHDALTLKEFIQNYEIALEEFLVEIGADRIVGAYPFRKRS